MPTKIEWATEVWNPVTGCTGISEGCANCYARRMAQRLHGRLLDGRLHEKWPDWQEAAMTDEEIGERILDYVISASLIEVDCAGLPEGAGKPVVLLVWAANAAEQLGAYVRDVVRSTGGDDDGAQNTEG